MSVPRHTDLFGALASHPDRLRDAPAIVKPLTGDLREMIEANAGSTLADRGLVPIAWLSDGGYWLLVSEDRNVLSRIERDELMRLSDPMVTMLIRARELLSLECGPVDSYRDPMKVQLHLGPRLLPAVLPRYRSPQFFIDHRVIVDGTKHWPVPVSLIDELPEDVFILSFRDRKGGLHLPLDYFLPGINDPLQQALAAQAILAATVTDAELLETVLRRHTAELLRNSELFPPPAHGRLAREIDLEQIPPLLSLYREFARYLYSSQFVTTRKRDGLNAGPSQWNERQAQLTELRSRIARLIPDDAEARDRFIEDWLPAEVAETIRRFARGWSVPDLESVSLPALRGAVRNLFAMRLIGQAGRSGTRKSSELKSHDFSYSDPAYELRSLFLERQVSHGELFERMFAESRFVVIRSNWIGGEKLLAAIEPHLPDDLLLVFSARITMLPFPRTGMGDADFDFIDAIINLFLRDGDPGTLEILTRPQLPGRAVHLLPAAESLLRVAHARNKTGRGRIRYFPDLADTVPLITAESVPVSDYCQRLCQRAEELGTRHVLWLETPWGVTEQSWRKPDINAPDAVHYSLRATVRDRAAWWIESARLAAQQSGQPADALAEANAANRVSVARFQVHHVSGDCGSPLYEALQDWWLGDFAISGPLPSGLAELPIHRVGQLREVFGNYNHLLVRVVGHDDRRDDEGQPDVAPAPGSLPNSIDQRQLNNT